MPLYEYECRGCCHRFETLQRVGETGEDLMCPRCGALSPERVLSTFASKAGVTTGGCAPSAPS